MAASNNILSFRAGGRRTALTEQARGVIADCRHVAQRALPKLMNGLFEKLDDALYELADKSDSSQLQNTYFDAMRTLRKHQGRIQSGFTDAVLREFDHFWRHGPRSLAVESLDERDFDEEDFELVDEDILEQSLAVNNLISKGENRYRRELYVLNNRFGTLAGGQTVEMDSNPLGPASICGSFHAAVRGIEVDTPVRLVIYKLFDKQVMHYVGGMYDEINSLLGRAGIASKQALRRTDPSRPRPLAHPPEQPPSMPRAAAELAPGRDLDDAYDHGDEQFQAELFHLLQQLLVGYRHTLGSRVALPSPHLPVVATPELIGALSDLQHASLRQIHHGDETFDDNLDVRHRLAEQLGLKNQGATSRVLDRVDEDTLDVIAMLFDFLLQDPVLPDAMKVLIARLQIPMLKTAIIDKGFFSQNLHPARRLLNTLARAAVGWFDDGDRSENSLYGRIESVVNRVVASFEDEPAIFDTLNEEFLAFVEREQRGAEIAEQRTNQVTRGKEQLRSAKALVGDEIERRLKVSPHAPQVVVELLDEGWKDVLLLTYLRHGSDSEMWKNHLELTDRLLWSVEPKYEYPQRQELLKAIPELLRSLREGLNGISYDQHRMARMLKELQACHIACLRGIKTPVKTVAAEQESPPQRVDEPPSEDENRQIALPVESSAEAKQYDHFTSMAEDLMIGAWLELQEDDGRHVRVKLSWKSDISDAYVFVNRKGVKVLEMTLAGVAKLFRRGVAEILMDVDVPIMDRALSAMVQTLQKNQSEDR